jgi:hypothetical protein
MKGKVYKTIVTLEVLSSEPLGNISLEDLAYQTEQGDMSLKSEQGKSIKLTGKKAVEVILSHGTDTEFFGMDKEGNEDSDYI